MTIRYLLDTNVLSEPLRAVPDAELVASLARHRREVATAAPVLHELEFGCRRLPESRKRRAIAHYIETVVAAAMPILPYDEAAARRHAAERTRLEALGHAAPFGDAQIAAIAAVNDLVLVTRDIDHFTCFEGLAVENWFGG